MKETFRLDITDQSYSYPNTPGQVYKNLPFVVQHCGHFHATSSYYTEREGMDSYLILLTLSGSGQLIHNGIGYLLTPGSITSFNCMPPHFYHTASDNHWEFLYIHCSGSAAGLYDQLLNEDKVSVIHKGITHSNTYSFLSIIRLIKDNDLKKELKIANLLTGLYTDLLLSKSTSADTDKRHQHATDMDTVIDHIQKNYMKKLSADDLASVAVLSKYHFIRLFKAHTGLSPYEYLINYRINRSKILLRETDDTVGNISEAIGFSDVNNYIRCFRKLTGITPGVYRKLY